MAECHLMFLVTIPIYDGSMKVRGHPHKRDLAKDILIKYRFKCKFCEKTSRTTLIVRLLILYNLLVIGVRIWCKVLFSGWNCGGSKKRMYFCQNN